MKTKEELLEIIRNKKHKVKSVEKVGDVPAFIRFYNITRGKEEISSLMLYFFYLKYSSNPLTFSVFCYRMSKYVIKNDMCFKIDFKASKLSMKEIFNATKSEITNWQKEKKKPFS